MKNTFKKTHSSILIVLSVVATVTSSCRKTEVVEPMVTGDANIRIVNTVLGSSPQDFYQLDTKVSTNTVGYGEFSNYLKVKAGTTTVSFRNTGATTASASANVGITTNASYTAFYYSTGSGSGYITGYTDDNTAPATGKARVRFVNLGPAFSNTINVSISGGAAIFTGLAFDKPSIYTSIDANTAIDVTVLSSSTTLTIPGSNFIAGKIYTVWFDAATTTSAKYHTVVQN